MASKQSQPGEGKAGHLLSLLRPEQREHVEARRRCCEACSQNRKLGVASVQCKACGCAGVSLIHGRCKLRKWPSGLGSGGKPVAMPHAPPPKPGPPSWEGRPVTPHAAHTTAGNTAQGAEPGSDLFIYGFPGLYAGARTELHHQIVMWRSMGLTVHLIPVDAGYRNEALYPEMIERGVIVHDANQFDVIRPGAPVLGFCNDRFLSRIDEVLRYSHNTVFVNCMTRLFDMEERRHREGKIAAFLYQNDEIRRRNAALLREINPDPFIQHLLFRPYFDPTAFPFVGAEEGGVGDPDKPFVIGRISRQDADKYSADTLRIWEAIDVPGEKRGVMLGFGPESEHKLGGLSDSFRGWVQTYANQAGLSRQDFYRRVDVIVQPMDTTENWPRVGLEAMASGGVLIVDNRGGWRQMIEHGKTGWLCDSPGDFVRYATQMAHKPRQRAEIARAARARLDDFAGYGVSGASWRAVLEQLGARVPALAGGATSR